MKNIVSQIPDYQKASRAHFDLLSQFDGKQPGDPEKGVSIILDFVRGEGIAAGRDTPFRLPLGTDAYQAVHTKCEETLELIKGNKDIICGTDISD